MNKKSHDELKKAFAIECITKGKTPYYIDSVRDIMDSFEEGGRDHVSLSEIVPGDALTFDGTMKSMLCSHDTKNSFLHFYQINIKDAMYDWSTGKFALITRDSILTNIDFSEELRLATAEALANHEYYNLSKMMRFHEKVSTKDAMLYLETNRDALGLNETQIRKLQWNPVALRKVAVGLMIEHQYEGADNGIEIVKQPYEINKDNELSVVSEILESIKSLQYAPPIIEQSQEQEQVEEYSSNEIDEIERH